MIYYTAYTLHPILRNHSVKVPKGIMLHSTGADNPNLKRYVNNPVRYGENRYNNHFDHPDATQTPHAFIGLDRKGKIETAQVLPWEWACWGCGTGKKGSYNYKPMYIQIEMCEDQSAGKDYLDKCLNEAVSTMAILCSRYNLMADQICSHKEAAAKGYASNHGDPEHWLEKYGVTMDDIRERVRERLSHLYYVQVGAFKSRKNAEAYAKDVASAGFQAIIKKGSD